MQRQTIKNQMGEVSYRKKLVVQHTSNTIITPDEPNFHENIRDIKNRLVRSEKVFKQLQSQNIRLTPFLEIAAGQGYRSDLLVSKFKADGFASDISQHVLHAGKIISKKLHLDKNSLKICCDANNLPFITNSFPFVFIALSLHHFPDPTPIIKEAIRVMAPNGYFYFDEEPIKQGLNLNLWRRGYHLSPLEKFLKIFIVLIFLSKIGKTEVHHGILEETFDLKLWQKALNQFDEVTVTEEVFPPVLGLRKIKHKTKHKNWIYPNLLIRFFLYLFGGGISGLCKIYKRGVKTNSYLKTRLGCPTCRKGDKLFPLKSNLTYLYCGKCKSRYFMKNETWMILEPKLLKKLYG